MFEIYPYQDYLYYRQYANYRSFYYQRSVGKHMKKFDVEVKESEVEL